MIPQNENVRQLVCHLYVYMVVEGSELHKKGDRNSVVSQASSSMDVA